jgi:hypothetical protein
LQGFTRYVLYSINVLDDGWLVEECSCVLGYVALLLVFTVHSVVGVSCRRFGGMEKIVARNLVYGRKDLSESSFRRGEKEEVIETAA